MRSSGLDINGRLLGIKKVSYGYGQLYEEAAMNAESIVARVEDRTPQDKEYVDSRIVSIEGAYEYAAALMIFYQEAYIDRGHPIANNPGILTTLYNIGKAQERLERTDAEDRRPEVNYFGWFAMHNWSIIEEAFKKSAFELTYISDQQVSLQERGTDGFGGTLVGMLMDDKVQAMSIPYDIPLRDNPPACEVGRDFFVNMRNVKRRDQAYLGSLEDSQLLPFKGKGSFDVYSKSFDCLGRIWGLVRFHESGHMGWINLETISPMLEMVSRSRQCQQNEVRESCLSQVQDIISENKLLSVDPTKGIVFVKLAGRNDSNEAIIDWRSNSENECRPSSVEHHLQLVENYHAVVNKVKSAKESDHFQKLKEELLDQWIEDYIQRRSGASSVSQKLIERREAWFEELLVQVSDDAKLYGNTGPVQEMSRNEIETLTPFVEQAIEKVEKEFDFPNLTYWAIKEAVMSERGEVLNLYDLNEYEFVVGILFWAYQFKDFCMDDEGDKRCFIFEPYEQVLHYAKDLAEHGVQAQSAKDLMGERAVRWFHPILQPRWVHLIDSGEDENVSHASAIDFIQAQISDLSEVSEVVKKVSDELSLIKQSPAMARLLQAPLASSRDMEHIQKAIDLLKHFYQGITELETDLQDENCFTAIVKWSSRDGVRESRVGTRVDLPCRHFSKFSWTSEEIYEFASSQLSQPFRQLQRKLESFSEKAERGIGPDDRDVSATHLENAKAVIEKCNFDYDSSIQRAVSLKNLQCVESFLFPNEKILIRRARELGLNFQVLPMGDQYDRFGVKVKTQCLR